MTRNAKSHIWLVLRVETSQDPSPNGNFPTRQLLWPEQITHCLFIWLFLKGNTIFAGYNLKMLMICFFLYNAVVEINLVQLLMYFQRRLGWLSLSFYLSLFLNRTFIVLPTCDPLSYLSTPFVSLFNSLLVCFITVFDVLLLVLLVVLLFLVFLFLTLPWFLLFAVFFTVCYCYLYFFHPGGTLTVLYLSIAIFCYFIFNSNTFTFYLITFIWWS